MKNREIEAKFLEIDKEALVAKLKSLGAEDQGEEILREIIFYDKDFNWQKNKDKIVRIRQTGKGIFLTYKDTQEKSLSGMEEIEFKIDSLDKAKDFLEALGLVAYRHQEKKRHKFILKDTIVDIDTFPKVPVYVELEGKTEDDVRETAKLLGFAWKNAVFGNSGVMIEDYYKIPVRHLRYFTFERIE